MSATKAYNVGGVGGNISATISQSINFGKIIGGKYCVFKISHTADSMQKAWMEIFSELSKRNYQFDDSRPILERYAIEMINKHYCEICVPIL